MQTLLSLLSFSDWIHNCPHKLSHKIVSEWSSFVDGFEILLSWPELIEFSERVRNTEIEIPGECASLTNEAMRTILDSSAFSIHVHDLKELSVEKRSQALTAINGLTDRFSHLTLVFHADEAPQILLDQIVPNLTSPRRCTIENMCPQKRELISLSEVAAFLDRYPELSLTFDICHWLEANSQETSLKEVSDFMASYGNRVRSIHVSVPTSAYSGYKKENFTRHHLLTRSDFPFHEVFRLVLSSASADVRCVSEGYFPVSFGNLVEEEIDYLKQVVREIQSQAQLS
ncbi:MAG: hypothetical protein KDD70_04315 [Bdellovibrionales bacterium]|nr:hypothetical protein [Bdellovibrionales bacterium]